MLTRAKRLVLLLIGVLALALGAVGIFVPLLPTTPLVLVAAFAFANSSETLHRWLLDHRVFGPLIHDWRRHGAISPFAKTISLLSMAAILAISLLLAAPVHAIVVQVVVLGACALFIVTRPSPPDS